MDSMTTYEAARIVCAVTIFVASLDTAAHKRVGTVVRPTTKLDIRMAPRRLFSQVSVMRATS